MAYHTHWLSSPIFSYHRLHNVSVKRLQCVLSQVTQCFLSRGYSVSCHRLQCFLSRGYSVSCHRLQCFLSQVTVFLVTVYKVSVIGYNVSCHRLQCFLSRGYSVSCHRLHCFLSEVTLCLVTDYSVFYTFLVTGYSVSQVKMFF